MRAQTPDAASAPPAGSLERLFPLVYRELKRVAHRQLASERTDHTLSTTALVHETYLRLLDQRQVTWADRGQFFAVAARSMRRILVDYARRHRAIRRGSGRRPITLDALEEVGRGTSEGIRIAAAERADELLALDEALERLAALDERLSRLVEYRFFAGLTEQEAAEALGVTARTVARDWVKAKGWLYRQLREEGAGGG